jgi:pectate lyase
MEENGRTRILQMLKAGVITVDEAEELLRALETKEPTAEQTVAFKDTRGRKNKKLRVQVDAGENEGKARVNINVPVSLIKSLGPVVVKNLPVEAKEELDKSGVDLISIMEGIESLIESGQDEDVVNVDVNKGSDTAKVRVYVE